MDLISCRNLLIYLGPVLQRRVLPVLHYALKPSGFLLLGRSEGVGEFSDLFKIVDSRQRIFSRVATSSRIKFDYGTSLIHGEGPLRGRAAASEPLPLDVQREAERLVLAKYAPAGVVVDEAYQVVQFRGQTGACLQPPSGHPTFDLLQLAREGLVVDLHAALDRAKQDNAPVRREAVRVKTNDHYQEFDLEVMPMTVPPDGKRFFVVLFQEAGPPPTETSPEAPAAATQPEQLEIERLSQELAATKEYLQSVIEGQEAANEELRVVNEEVVSSNEELQSMNEELETAKEELQATNEELVTVNDELQSRIAFAARLSDDLANLVDCIDVPTVVLGPDLQIRRYSPSAQRVLNLTPNDVGRPIGDFKLKIEVPDLESWAHRVLETLAPPGARGDRSRRTLASPDCAPLPHRGPADRRRRGHAGRYRHAQTAGTASRRGPRFRRRHRRDRAGKPADSRSGTCAWCGPIRATTTCFRSPGGHGKPARVSDRTRRVERARVADAVG